METGPLPPGPGVPMAWDPGSHGPRSKSGDDAGLNHLVVAQLSKTKMCAMQGNLDGKWSMDCPDATATEFVPLHIFTYHYIYTYIYIYMYVCICEYINILLYHLISFECM